MSMGRATKNHYLCENRCELAAFNPGQEKVCCLWSSKAVPPRPCFLRVPSKHFSSVLSQSIESQHDRECITVALFA